MNQIQKQSELLDLFEEDPETHLYGLGDLEEPYWSNSTWFREGKSAVGIVSAGGDWLTGYAMSRVAPEETLDMLLAVHNRLPEGTWVTGAIGISDTLRGHRPLRSIGPHWRMILDDFHPVDDTAPVSNLSLEDLPALTDLHETDPGRAFWITGMLASYPFVGVWEDDRLVASAGCHVASERHGVAAIGGIFVRPSHRGEGLGRLITSEVCRRLLGRFATIGLNVQATNEPAIRMYDRLGFRSAFQYEEIELL